MHETQQNSLIWIQRPYYYMTQPHIKTLIKVENELNIQKMKEFIARYREEQKCYFYKPARLFLMYEQMLYLSIPTHGVLRYSDKCVYTAKLLSYALDGEFDESEVEEALEIFEKQIHLISKDDKGVIYLTYFDSSVPGIGRALVEELEAKESSSEDGNIFTSMLVKLGYLKKNDSQVELFDDYFESRIKELPITTEKIKEIIAIFVKRDVPKLKQKPKDKFAVFKTSFENALKKLKSDEDEINLEELLKAVQG